MGPFPSRPSLSNVVNTLQSALVRRSDRRVEPAPETQSKLCANTSVLSAKRLGKRHRFGAWKRNPMRSYCSCVGKEDDDYARVFGRQRPGSTQSLPSAIPVRRCRSDFSSRLPPAQEYRLFIENIEVEGHSGTIESTYKEETTTITTQVCSDARVVRCRYCRSAVSTRESTCVSASPSRCATPIPQPSTRPTCRACVWHSLLPHECECFGPPVSRLSWDVERDRFQRACSTPVIPPIGRPRTMFSLKTQEPETEITGPDCQQEVNLSAPVPDPPSKKEPELKPEPDPVKKESTEEAPPCVCALPSKKTCPCDKKLFEAMKPWNKIKTVLLSLLAAALLAWLIAFLVI